MTNPEPNPDEVVCATGDTSVGGVQVLAPRQVPLGGPRAMLVRRTLPARERSLIGAWCFLDHYGPQNIVDTGGMQVTPHPHTGLQTVSWLFTGEIEHQDSLGTTALVRPGELNLMTAGRGISHSEISTRGVDELHGVQLWVALPDPDRNVDPAFDHFVPEPVSGPGWQARVFLGEALGAASPVRTFTPLLGAEISMAAGTELEVPVDASYEHGVLVDSGVATLACPRSGEQELKSAELGYLAPGPDTLELRAEQDSRLLLLGGPPFGEQIVMWWNFVGRSHEEVVGYRDEWQAQISRDGEVVADSRAVAPGRFGVVDIERAPIPAPALPNVRLRSRG